MTGPTEINLAAEWWSLFVFVVQLGGLAGGWLALGLAAWFFLTDWDDHAW